MQEMATYAANLEAENGNFYPIMFYAIIQPPIKKRIISYNFFPLRTSENQPFYLHLHNMAPVLLIHR